jgi:hypothetical protein
MLLDDPAYGHVWQQTTHGVVAVSQHAHHHSVRKWGCDFQQPVYQGMFLNITVPQVCASRLDRLRCIGRFFQQHHTDTGHPKRPHFLNGSLDVWMSRGRFRRLSGIKGIVLLLRAGDQVLLLSFFTPAYRLAAALTRSAFSPGLACAAP